VLVAVFYGVIVERRLGRLDFPFELFILGFELGVVLDTFVELAADPVCAAGGALGFSTALFDESFAMFLLLIGGESHNPQH
jgi:hypothetical protein